jgi:BirA family biotin operon repressor/biotin-[acetyl-CoA-carboxylase] ligase
LAAVSVCETIFQCTRLQAAIKWPNDILLHGRKVCGILVEQGQGTVIGIGLNVNTPAEAFADAQLPQAGSLAMMTNRSLDRGLIFRNLVQQLDSNYESLVTGLEGDLEARWRWHSGLLGKHVTIATQGKTYHGRLLDLSFSAVDLQEPQGNIRRLSPDLLEAITPCPVQSPPP